jgi:hypothetical protein
MMCSDQNTLTSLSHWRFGHQVQDASIEGRYLKDFTASCTVLIDWTTVLVFST